MKLFSYHRIARHPIGFPYIFGASTFRIGYAPNQMMQVHRLKDIFALHHTASRPFDFPNINREWASTIHMYYRSTITMHAHIRYHVYRRPGSCEHWPAVRSRTR